MTIKKFEGKTKDEAINAAKRELGQEVVIMNIKEVKPNGLFGVFKKSIFEVTAALEDEEVQKHSSFSGDLKNTENSIHSDSASLRLKKPHSDEKKPSFSAAADEDIPVSSFSGNRENEREPLPPLNASAFTQKENVFSRVDEENLKSAFKEINEVIDKAERVNPSFEDTSFRSPVIKQDEYVREQSPVQRNRYIEEESPVQRSRYTDEVPSYNDSQNPALSERSIDRQADALRRAQAERYGNYESSSEEDNDIYDDEPYGQRELLLKYENNHEFIKTLYNILMAHEVDEIYINRIISEMGDILRSDNSLDFLIANVYQKIVLLLGNPKPIVLSQNPLKRPQIVFFTGPTGVGKTTTIAKIASEFKVRMRDEVALITTDTYRIAATEQLAVYADILRVPMTIAYTPEDVIAGIENYRDKDLILVDTVGFSHKNDTQKENIKKFLSTAPEDKDKRVFLVLSTTTKYTDIKEIIDAYKDITDFDIVFTKLDETDNYGNILNAKLYSGKNLSYVTTGQNVPDDISEIDVQVLTKTLLGGNKNGSGRTPEKRD